MRVHQDPHVELYPLHEEHIMSRTTLLGILCASGLLVYQQGVHCAQAMPPEVAARGVLQRVIPEVADAFLLETIPQDDGHDVFEVESVDGKIIVRGSNGVAITSGVNWYLKYRMPLSAVL